MLTHVPDLADLLLCVWILRDGLCQICAVSSVAVCQLLQRLNKSTQKERLRIWEKPHIHKQTQAAWHNVYVYLAAALVLSSGLSGLCLLEERVLLLSPCQEEKKRAWTRRRLPLLCRPELGFRINARAWWIHVTHLIVSSAGPPLSAGVQAPPGGALSWNCKKRKTQLSCDFCPVTCVFAKMKMSHRHLPSSRLRCKHSNFEPDPSSPQSAVTRPPRLHP